jgi:hypothetical protein
MDTSIQLYIPEPCHENWNAMTPKEQGRFCNACAKVVVDFSKMSDKEILDYISSVSGKMCGRLVEDQLNRTLSYPAKPKKLWWKYWVNIAVSFALLVAKVSAQVKQPREKIEVLPPKMTPPEKLDTEKILLGRIGSVSIDSKDEVFILMKGKVVDNEGNPIVGASVLIKGGNRGTAADTSGEFILKIKEKKTTTLVFSAVGFMSTELSVKGQNELKDILHVEMKMQPMISGEIGVVVVAKKKKKSIFNILKKDEPVCSKENSSPVMKIYPNPVVAGNTIHIRIAGVVPGKYLVSIYDVNGVAIAGKEINTGKLNVLEESFNSDSRFRSGVYTIKVSGAGKTYTQLYTVL